MCDEEPQPLKVRELAALASQRLENLRREGRVLNPVINKSRKLATHFWGSAWMKHLARCEAGGLCLAPGRTLLRHGCVLDLQLSEGLITAWVSAEELREVHLRVDPLDDERVENLRLSCRGHIASLVSLLEGKVSESVLSLLCDPERGLLPEPAEWHMACSCPDWCEPCVHAAAAIYAAGTLIDTDPMLLFTLRGIVPSTLLSVPEQQGHSFDLASLSGTFAIDLDIDI